MVWARLRNRWWFQAAIIVATYEAYRYVRIAVRGSPHRAFSYAKQLLHVEEVLRIAHERTVQDWLLPARWLIRFFDAYHGMAHFFAVGLTLLLLWRFDRAQYRFWRNVFGWILAVGIVGFLLLPLTPPRLMPSRYGYVDTAVEIGGIGPVGRETGAAGGGGGNEFACMPSLHAAWSLWVALAMWAFARWWGRGLLALHVGIMHVAIIATAKHWILDAPGGWIALAIAIALERARSRWWSVHHGTTT